MDTRDKAYQWIDEHKDEMVSLRKEMVTIDSGIGVRDGGMAMGNLCAGILEELGFSICRVSYEKCGDTIIGERGDMTKPFTILMGHMDTVFFKGEPEKRPFTIKDGKAYGPGVLDMKGGVTILLSTLKALHEAGFEDFPCKVILDADEEPAHVFSNAPEVIQKEAEGAKCAFNFETGFTDHSLVVQRKGCWRFFIETFGRGCHVGNDPENGRSAILEMAHKIIEIEKLTDYSKQYNVNVGTIEGGTVANAAPAYCKVECDFRYTHPEDLPVLRRKVDEVCSRQYVPDTTTKVSDSVGFATMTRLPGNLELLKIAQEVAEESGFPKPEARLCGGGSDAAYTTAMGVPTLCAVGVEGARNHTVEEWADVDSLFRRAKQMAGILLKVNGSK
ncbi:MAG: M20 family metallopeptidase [Dialister sp.]|uniref:M20 family metallopeptidase n=1 Tax=Dialister sp. TaxID=1955814 RepID=UPI002E764CA5|nr:M20 family metallopeptidase [Dialister sp.]MEE0291462.1 M20 family metallopeptidase [Dialister sp.]